MCEDKYKVGDRVKIKSLDWYNENKDKDGFVDFSTSVFVPGMSQFCGKIVTIEDVFEEEDDVVYCMEGIDYDWTNEMFEGLAEEETKPEPKFKIGEVVYVIDYDTDLKIQNRIYKNGMWNYIINIESAPFIFYDNELKKKKEYPKSFGECCKVLGTYSYSQSIVGYKHELFSVLQKLLMCRDAYWKIAGEEMGLGKPWELSIGIPIYYIYYNRTLGTIKKDYADDIQGNVILAFPTEEMRDAFYENFKGLIEQCKELL